MPWIICDRTGKRGYDSQHMARRSHCGAGYRVRVYRCDACGRYHVANAEKDRPWETKGRRR